MYKLELKYRNNEHQLAKERQTQLHLFLRKQMTHAAEEGPTGPTGAVPRNVSTPLEGRLRRSLAQLPFVANALRGQQPFAIEAQQLENIIFERNSDDEWRKLVQSLPQVDLQGESHPDGIPSAIGALAKGAHLQEGEDEGESSKATLSGPWHATTARSSFTAFPSSLISSTMSGFSRVSTKNIGTSKLFLPRLQSQTLHQDASTASLASTSRWTRGMQASSATLAPQHSQRLPVIPSSPIRSPRQPAMPAILQRSKGKANKPPQHWQIVVNQPYSLLTADVVNITVDPGSRKHRFKFTK